MASTDWVFASQQYLWPSLRTGSRTCVPNRSKGSTNNLRLISSAKALGSKCSVSQRAVFGRPACIYCCYWEELCSPCEGAKLTAAQYYIFAPMVQTFDPVLGLGSAASSFSAAESRWPEWSGAAPTNVLAQYWSASTSDNGRNLR